jgi:hypothetical protein
MIIPSVGADRARRVFTSALSRSWRSLAQLLRTIWQAHRAMLERNAAYATAMAAAGAEIFTQAHIDRLLASVVFAVVAIYLAIRYGRSVTSTWPAETEPWGVSTPP